MNSKELRFLGLGLVFLALGSFISAVAAPGLARGLLGSCLTLLGGMMGFVVVVRVWASDRPMLGGCGASIDPATSNSRIPKAK